MKRLGDSVKFCRRFAGRMQTTSEFSVYNGPLLLSENTLANGRVAAVECEVEAGKTLRTPTRQRL
jgi:hypothetical protein